MSGTATPHPLARLRALLNLSGEPSWEIVVDWLLDAMRPAGPHPVLILQGPTGSGKSCAARLLASILELFAQIPDVHVDSVAEAVEMLIPHVLGDHGPRQHNSAVAHEILKQRELLAR